MKREPESCERHEVLISTWMDEGLERDDQRELFDHIARCPGCRRFYADARALEGLVALAGAAAGSESPPPPGLWDRIRNRAEEEPADAGAWPSWAWRAAAALLLGAALAFAPWPSTRPQGGSARQLEVVLEEDRGDMTESRFLELATELLRADRRYHFAMQEVMEKVIDDEWKPEGVTSEGLSEEPGNDEEKGEGPPFRV